MLQTPFFILFININNSIMEDLRNEINKIFRETLISEEFPVSQQMMQPESQAKPVTYRFNKGMENEFLVTFSERGFLVGDTRLSFEELQNAISKQYAMTLKDGFVLDAIKMQQILKYKNKF